MAVGSPNRRIEGNPHDGFRGPYVGVGSSKPCTRMEDTTEVKETSSVIGSTLTPYRKLPICRRQGPAGLQPDRV